MLSNVATASVSALDAPGNQRTTRPVVTGTSVVGIKYKDGVMIAADTLCSYGSMAKFKDVPRLFSVNANTLVGGGGEYSDFQSIVQMLKENTLEERCLSDTLYDDHSEVECAKEVWNYLRAVMYQRRNKMDPLWNDLVVAGFAKEGGASTPFLGYVDKIGTTFEDDIIATGFGSYMAMPILREKYRDDLEEGEARGILEDCLRVLFYRDCRALNRIQIAKATSDGVLVSDPYELETSWDSASFMSPKGGLEGDGGW